MTLFQLLLAIGAVLAMEVAATLFHKHVMHGFGWGWHASHHLTRKHGAWETNDLYTLVFASATVLLFYIGDQYPSLWWIALGITFYGLLYAVLHDVVVHRRLPLKWQARNGYLKHLTTAHHLHHASSTSDDGVSFGFLYAPPLDAIRRQMRNRERQA